MLTYCRCKYSQVSIHNTQYTIHNILLLISTMNDATQNFRTLYDVQFTLYDVHFLQCVVYTLHRRKYMIFYLLVLLGIVPISLVSCGIHSKFYISSRWYTLPVPSGKCLQRHILIKFVLYKITCEVL